MKTDWVELRDATYIMQFVVQSAGIAHRFPVLVAPPERGGGGLAVGARGARTPRRALQRLE